MSKKYSIILMDIPWSYRDKANSGNRGASYKYPTMNIDEICKLPINSISADDCVLFLWATFPLLQEALDVIKAYGFCYKTIGFNFIKTNKVATDTLFFGMGNWTRSNSEICLLATKGSPKRISASIHSVIMSPIEAHSKKPDIIRTKIVQLMGDLPRIEIFGRIPVDGWDVIGNEIDGLDIRDALNNIIKQ